eukprot:366488-Chlamydomonas_euryale.AAC.18
MVCPCPSSPVHDALRVQHLQHRQQRLHDALDRLSFRQRPVLIVHVLVQVAASASARRPHGTPGGATARSALRGCTPSVRRACCCAGRPPACVYERVCVGEGQSRAWVERLTGPDPTTAHPPPPSMPGLSKATATHLVHKRRRPRKELAAHGVVSERPRVPHHGPWQVSR